MASANGTYVNSKRVRVAPLTHGAKLRMGNTYGRFSEELPTEGDGAQEPEMEQMTTSEHEQISVSTTQPHDKAGADDSKKKAQ